MRIAPHPPREETVLPDLLHRRREARLAEQHLRPSAIDLNLRDVLYIRRNFHFAFLSVRAERALNFERIERVDVAPAIDYAPGWRRRIRHFEIVGDLQHAL